MIVWKPLFTVALMALYSQSSFGQLIVAHRGASADAPENTLAAFNLAWEHDADAIEGDFYLTQDNQIVAIHDRSTKRTCGVDLDVCKSKWSELKKLDAGTWKSKEFSGEPLPTLEQVVDCLPKNKLFVMEIKDSPRIVPVLAAKIQANPKLKSLLSDNHLKIIAFDSEVVKACKKQIPGINAVWLSSFKRDENSNHISPTIEQIIEQLAECKADGLDCKAADHIDQNFVDKLRNARKESPYEFHVWTVDDPSTARRFVELGVDSITTNKPALMVQQLKVSAESK